MLRKALSTALALGQVLGGQPLLHAAGLRSRGASPPPAGRPALPATARQRISEAALPRVIARSAARQRISEAGRVPTAPGGGGPLDAAVKTIDTLRESESIQALADPKTADKEIPLRELFHGRKTGLGGSAPVPASGTSGPGASMPASGLAPAGISGHGRAAPPALDSLPSGRKRSAGRAGNAAGLALAATSLASVTATGLISLGMGLPFSLGPAATAALASAYSVWLRRPKAAERVLEGLKARALKAGGRQATNAQAPRLMSEIADLRAEKDAPMPTVILMPGGFPVSAKALGLAGRRETVLLVNERLMSHPQRRVILAHELRHVADMPRLWLALPNFAWAAAGLTGLAAAANLGLRWLGWPSLDPPALGQALQTLLIGVPALLGLRLSHFLLMEKRADLSAAEVTGDSRGISQALGGRGLLASRLKSLKDALRVLRASASVDKIERHFPAPASASDEDPAYYEAVPEWALRLKPDAGKALAIPKQRQRYEAELSRLRPLARWMAHVYARLKDTTVFRPPNPLTIQDLLNWADLIKKFEATRGWDLRSAALEGAQSIFSRSLPEEPYEGRTLKREAERLLQDASAILAELQVPAHLDPVPRESSAGETAAAEKPMAEFLEESAALFEAKDAEGAGELDYIATKTVRERLKDLMMLYSTGHRRKFFPLLIGDTAEGKSSLVKFMFSQPALKKALEGRSVPVVSLPVKEAMTRRELLGGKSGQGVELGILCLAAMHGWVLVLEELNQASGEFLKALNDVSHQIRQKGYFEFEVGQQTVRIKVHPHFWLVGTENPEEGNYALTRTPHSPDFMKRWVVRHYGRFPPSEQAEIMRGLAQRWYGDAFAGRHGLSQDFFEKLMTEFHEPLRKLAVSGRLGGDLQEPYEFNRRTLHRFLKRYLHDLWSYESRKEPWSRGLRYRLMARELLEAYGTEVRSSGERQAIWDKMNTVFELESKWKVGLEDDPGQGLSGIDLRITGFHTSGGKLIVRERLVPIEIPLRRNGGPRVPGPESRLTLTPSLARSVYRNLRNRQFREHQFSTGPTGTAKTSEQFFINHLLGEPLLSMTLDEQTPMAELHGGFLKDPASGDFKFLPGILARAMMHDPEGLLRASPGPGPADVRRSPRIGATLLVNEGNASPILESINPALDDGVLNLSDGRHMAVGGGAFHVTVTMNPVGEGYAGFPLTGALRSRAQTVEHPDEAVEEELAEIILDRLTGLTRHLLDEP